MSRGQESFTRLCIRSFDLGSYYGLASVIGRFLLWAPYSTGPWCLGQHEAPLILKGRNSVFLGNDLAAYMLIANNMHNGSDVCGVSGFWLEVSASLIEGPCLSFWGHL